MIELYQHRSYAKCISEGFKFLAENIWLVTKVMWPYFLLVSIIGVVFNALNIHINVSDLAGKQVYLEEGIAVLALLALLIVAYIFTLRRMYIMFKRLCGFNGKKHIFIKKVLKAFFKHFGKITGTTLLALFLLVIMSVIAYLPYVIANYTYFSCIEGQVNFGDNVEIPIGGYVLIFVCCVLSYFIINMFSVAFYASEMYLYGSVRSTTKS